MQQGDLRFTRFTFRFTASKFSKVNHVLGVLSGKESIKQDKKTLGLLSKRVVNKHATSTQHIFVALSKLK